VDSLAGPTTLYEMLTKFSRPIDLHSTRYVMPEYLCMLKLQSGYDKYGDLKPQTWNWNWNWNLKLKP